MGSLEGVADEWDSCPHVRESVRQHGTLFVKEVGQAEVRATIACAQINYHVLKPLVERLEGSPGVLGMHALPHLKRQNLALFTSLPFYFVGFRCFHILETSTIPLATIAPGCYQSSTCFDIQHHPTLLRIKAFYIKFQVPVPNSKALRSEAKAAKKFMVLIKSKFHRGQACRTILFRKLLASAYASTRSKVEE